MKTTFYILLMTGFLATVSCKKDKDSSKDLAQNTWTFTLADGYPDKVSSTFEMKSIVLNIQGYGQLYAQSKDRATLGDGRGTAGSVTIYFKGMPLADKEYKVTSLERIATHDDEVAIGVMVAGHSFISESGAGGITFMSDGDGSQKLIYKFADSKGSAEFKDVKVWIGHPTARKSALVSAKISQ